MPLEIHGDGSQTRTFCHVHDTIRALHGLVESPDTNGQIYNVGSPDRISILDLAHRVLGSTGSSSELVYVPYDEVYGLGIEDTLHRVPSIEKIDGAISWAPHRSLDEILDDVIAQERERAAAA
jgi:UDP-glucose 4-epimerase